MHLNAGCITFNQPFGNSNVPIVPYAVSLACPITRPARASRKYLSNGSRPAKAVPPNMVIRSEVTRTPASEQRTLACKSGSIDVARLESTIAAAACNKALAASIWALISDIRRRFIGLSSRRAPLG